MMKKFYQLFAIIVCLSIIFHFNCKKVIEPLAEIIPAKVEIEDVWLTDMIDHDSDGYFSDGRLYFDLSTNKTLGVKCFAWLGYKLSVYVDSNIYYKCWVSIDLNIKKGSPNKYYTFVSKFNDSLPQDRYDLLLVIYLSSAPNDPVDKESDDEDFHNIPLEPRATDTLPVAHRAFHVNNDPDQTALEALPSDTRLQRTEGLK